MNHANTLEDLTMHGQQVGNSRHGKTISRFRISRWCFFSTSRNAMLIQQVEGVARACFSFNQYSGLTPNRFNAAWEIIYEDILSKNIII